MHDLDAMLDPEDRDAALERGFTQHDTLEFRGKPLKPLSVATYSVLQRAGNRLVLGGSTDPFGDAMGFILIHSADPKESREARARVWAGAASWNEYVFNYLDEHPDVHEDLFAAIPMFRAMIDDFAKAVTKSVSAGDLKKKSGPQVT
jgi:hypothetical protein